MDEENYDFFGGVRDRKKILTLRGSCPIAPNGELLAAKTFKTALNPRQACKNDAGIAEPSNLCPYNREPLIKKSEVQV